MKISRWTGGDCSNRARTAFHTFTSRKHEVLRAGTLWRTFLRLAICQAVKDGRENIKMRKVLTWKVFFPVYTQAQTEQETCLSSMRIWQEKKKKKLIITLSIKGIMNTILLDYIVYSFISPTCVTIYLTFLSHKAFFLIVCLH